MSISTRWQHCIIIENHDVAQVLDCTPQWHILRSTEWMPVFIATLNLEIYEQFPSQGVLQF